MIQLERKTVHKTSLADIQHSRRAYLTWLRPPLAVIFAICKSFTAEWWPRDEKMKILKKLQHLVADNSQCLIERDSRNKTNKYSMARNLNYYVRSLNMVLVSENGASNWLNALRLQNMSSSFAPNRKNSETV